MATELENYNATLAMLFGQAADVLRDITPEALAYIPFTRDAARGQTASAGWFLAHGVASTVYLLRQAQFVAGQIAWTAVTGDRGADEFTTADHDPSLLRARLQSVEAECLKTLQSLMAADLGAEVAHPKRPERILRARYCITHAIDHLSQHIGHAQMARQIAEVMRLKPIG